MGTAALDLAQRGQLRVFLESSLDKILGATSALTSAGREIDAHQVMTRRAANLATRFEAARNLLEYAEQYGESEAVASVFVSEVARDVAAEADQSLDDLGLSEDDFAEGVGHPDARSLYRAGLREANYRAIAEKLLSEGAEARRPIWTESGEDADEIELRASTRRFARDAVAPLAEDIHRQDLLVPEDLLQQMAELGYFGMSIPEEYGGVGMSCLMMVLATEELSAASLSGAGSLITRPEILAKALLDGGTEEQKSKWLEPVATGKRMVAVAVTEPNTGSDVAGLTCSATPGSVEGREGYLINGAKAWCTFAGRADLLALLARSDPDSASGHRGLSLFIVEKDPFTGHEFEMIQPSGGRMTGKADATLGYRGMHSFTLQFEDYFVPAENLVGGEDGIGKGFYLQMGGFAAGRLQTGGRAVGLAQASLEAAVQYTLGRPQFGKPIAEFQSTRYEIGAMAVHVEAARQLTHAAARAMDRGDDRSALMVAMAKLFACRVAVDVSQRGQILHGGWGYAEEYAISRYVVDALVLPLFEGVEPILEMKVIGRALLKEASPSQ